MDFFLDVLDHLILFYSNLSSVYFCVVVFQDMGTVIVILTDGSLFSDFDIRNFHVCNK